MLELHHVEKLFLGDKGIHDITITFQPGEIYGILGRNGSGKTTLLKCILGLLEVDRGQILLNGKPACEQLQDIAFASADGSSLPYMKGKEYGQFLAQYYPSFSMEDYLHFLNRFELDAQERIASLSKGGKMKIELAAAFAQHAKLILMDEPFTSLDMYANEDCIHAVLEEVMEERILLISTHDIAEIETIADGCLVLENGRLAEVFTMDDLHEQGEDLKTRLAAYRPEKDKENRE